jgi:ABC-type molybdate transport system substrate-binding protein
MGLNTSANYLIAPLNGSPNAALADAFNAYLLAPASQAVLVRYGFSSPTGTGSDAMQIAAVVR